MSRLLHYANEALLSGVLFVAMATSQLSQQGPSWQAIATGGGAIVVGVAGWVVTDRLSQQAERDRKQDENIEQSRKDSFAALERIISENKEQTKRQEVNTQRLTDSIDSVVNKVHEAAIRSLELGIIVKDLQGNMNEIRQRDQQRIEREMDDLRGKDKGKTK